MDPFPTAAPLPTLYRCAGCGQYVTSPHLCWTAPAAPQTVPVTVPLDGNGFSWTITPTPPPATAAQVAALAAQVAHLQASLDELLARNPVRARP